MEERTKFCPRCQQVKPWGDYFIDRRRARPQAYCKTCNYAYYRGRYAKPPAHATNCKQCGEPITPRRSNRPILFCGKTCLTNWHNDHQTRDYRRDSWLRSAYGISLDAYIELLEAQGGKCRLCDATEEDAKRGTLDVDHDHLTGRIRGLLCHRCNLALGMFGDSLDWLRAAADYLEEHRAAHPFVAAGDP